MEETIKVEELTGWVYEGKLGKLQSNISKMNRKAAKLGCDPLLLTVTDETDYRRINPEDPFSHKIKYIKVHLLGETPKLSDWELVAACDHDPVIGMTVRAVPGKVLPEQYKENDSYCEHCKSKRQRNSTYIVENTKTNELKRVGSTCIKDFLGHQAAEMFLFRASYMTLMLALEDEYGYDRNERGPEYLGLGYVLALTEKCIAKWGYTSRTKAKEENLPVSTADDVLNQIFPPKSEEAKALTVNEQEIEAVQPIIDWVKALPETSDYNMNLIKIANAGVTTLQLIGFAVSMVPSYRKAMDLIEQRAKQKPSEWVGTEKQRLTMKLRYTKSFTSDGYYGITYYHKFEDENGNYFSWHTKDSIDNVHTCWFTVLGTIKSHEEYKSIKTTNLSRCVLTPSMEPFWTIEKKEG